MHPVVIALSSVNHAAAGRKFEPTKCECPNRLWSVP